MRTEIDVIVLDHCSYCEIKLDLKTFSQYYIKDESDKVVGVSVRCLKHKMNVPKNWELIPRKSEVI